MSTEEPKPGEGKAGEPVAQGSEAKAAATAAANAAAVPEAQKPGAAAEAAPETPLPVEPAGPPPKKSVLVPLVLIAGAAVSTLVSIVIVQVRLKSSLARVLKERENMPLTLIHQAQSAEGYGRPEKAFQLHQLAIVNALTEERRLDAGLAMAEFLARQLPLNPPLYAIQVRQYAEAILEKDKRPDRALRAHQALLEAARVTKDMEALLREAGIVGELTEAPEDKARLMMVCLDTAIDIRDYARAQELLQGTAHLGDDPDWKAEWRLRKARIGHLMISNPDWARAEANLQGRELTEDLKKAWAEPVAAQYREVAASGRTRPATQAIFRLAELTFEIGLYDESFRYVEEFLKRESGEYQGEVLLIMIRLARARGESRRAERLIAVFLERFPWNHVMMDEFVMVIREAEKRGHVREALALVDRYKAMPSAKNDQPRLLTLAAELATGAGLTNRADRYYTELLDLKPPDEMVMKALLAKAEICRQGGDWAGASDHLVRYLREYPYEARRGSALFNLYECQKRMNAEPVGLMRLAMAAVTEQPEDPRTAALLLEVAGRLEEGGMYAIAQQQYNRVALLHYVAMDAGGGTSRVRTATADTFSRAQLGSARCHMKSEEPLKAERILRDLCADEESGPVRSEAAYLWATQASEERQFAEARRRLDLVDGRIAAPEVARLAAIERMIVEVAVGERPVDEIGEILGRIAGLPAADHGGFIRRTYRVCFDRLEKDKAMAGLRRFVDAASTSPHAAILPVTEFYLRLGKLILTDRGVEEFSRYMQDVSQQFQREAVVFPGGVDIVKSVAADVEKQTRMAGGLL